MGEKDGKSEDDTTTFYGVVTDQGNGSDHCAKCHWSTASVSPHANVCELKFCPGCGRLITDIECLSPNDQGFGGSDF